MTQKKSSREIQEELIAKLEAHARTWTIFWTREHWLDVLDCLRGLAREAGLKPPSPPWDPHVADRDPEWVEAHRDEIGWQVIPMLLPPEKAVNLIVTLTRKIDGNRYYDAAAVALRKMNHPKAREGLRKINRA